VKARDTMTLVLVNPRFGLRAQDITTDSFQVHSVCDVDQAVRVVQVEAPLCVAERACRCEYCGCIYDSATRDKCPNCGAPDRRGL
jgi:hypothetical protein